MTKHDHQVRNLAVQRFLNGEKPRSICSSLGKSKSWLYKWVSRYNPHEPSWYKNKSKRPCNNPLRTTSEIEEIVKMLRLNLYNQDLYYGAQAIQWELEDLNVQPIPSFKHD